MSKDGEWGTQAEMFAASDLFDRDIYVYTKCGAGHKWLRYVIQQCDGQHKRDYIALHCDGNHFNLLQPTIFAKETAMKGRERRRVKHHSVTLCRINIKCAME